MKECICVLGVKCMLVIQKCFLEKFPLKPLLSWSHCKDLCTTEVRVFRRAGSVPECEATE